MGIEINGARRNADGSFECRVWFPNQGSYVRGTSALLDTVAEAFQPAFSHAQSLTLRRVAAEMATGRRIPRASVPPYDTTLGGQPLPEPELRPVDLDPVGFVEALMQTQVEEPEGLKAGEAYGAEAHERKAGGTSSDEGED